MSLQCMLIQCDNLSIVSINHNQIYHSGQYPKFGTNRLIKNRLPYR